MQVQAYFLSILLLVGVFFAISNSAAYSQEKDEILVAGNPPLTRLMAGKVIVLLDWVLELKLTNPQQVKISEVLIRSWRANNREDIQGALEIIKIYERVAPLSESERNNTKGKLQEVILQSMRAEPDDELARLLLSAYEATHPTNSKPASQSKSLTANNRRIGTDGFSGLYRLVRPKTVGVGIVIEYLAFLPDGHVLWRLPTEGFLYFDSHVAGKNHPNDWGTYEIKNNEVHVLRGPEKKLYVITRNGERLNNPPGLGKGTFRPVPTADGLRLEGTYRRVGNEQSPKVAFTKDGRFQDAGAFKYSAYTRLDWTTYTDDGVGGKGTYLIDQNTLELRYSDGRVKRFVFMTFPENLAKKPAIDSFIINHNDSLVID